MHDTMKRLYKAALTLNLSGSTDVAHALGESPQTVKNWEYRGVSKSGMLKAQDAFNVDAGWIADGVDRRITNITSAPDISGYVPLVSWVKAGNFNEAIDMYQAGYADEFVPITVPKGRHTFALEVVGDSMYPDFPAGMRLIIEPDMEFQSGDYVIAKNGGEATFKQLVRDGGDWYLKPINPQYPTKPLGESHIIGVVREAVRKFR